MNFDELDKRMRRFETSLDQIILPELYMVVRIDGRNFTKLRAVSERSDQGDRGKICCV